MASNILPSIREIFNLPQYQQNIPTDNNTSGLDNSQPHSDRTTRETTVRYIPQRAVPYDKEQIPLRLLERKKQRKSYSTKFKLDILDEIDRHGFSFVEVKRGIDHSILYRWMKNRSRLLDAFENGKGRRSRIFECGQPCLPLQAEDEIISKVNELRESMIPVTGVLVKIFALQTAKQWRMGDSFKASDGWLQGFKRRHDLVFRKGTKRSPKVDNEIAQRLINMQRTVYNRIITEEIDYLLNIDETPIVYDLVYDHTLATCGSSEVLISKVGDSKKRFTACLGILQPLKSSVPQVFKCKPMLIFKGTSDRCIKDVCTSYKNDPYLIIKYQKKAWNDETLYCHYLKECLPPQLAGKNYKILVIHDNVSFHLSASVVETCEKEMKIKPFCLPDNSTALCQPLDVAINKPVKAGLRKRMMTHLVDNYKGGRLCISKNILISWLKDVWENDIRDEVIQKSFRICGLGVSPVDNTQPIYWKKLQSLQSHFRQLEETLPSITQLTRSIFRETPSNEEHPQVFLYTPQQYEQHLYFR